MNFEKGHLYHIFNQGNNRQKIFFSRENYLFFLNKVNTHLLPYTDIIAWCLMPNHFHFMVYIKHLEKKRTSESKPTQSLNHSIGIMLASYTRAINKQQNKSGSLFRQKTKAECITCYDGNTPSFFGSKINIQPAKRQYPQVCFDYIHNNPLKAKLVKNTQDWEFSSASDYASIRNGKLINKALAKEFVDW